MAVPGHKTMSVFKRYNLVTEDELSHVKWHDANDEVQYKKTVETNKCRTVDCEKIMITDKDILSKNAIFQEYMRTINKRLQDREVPIHARPIQAFREIALDGKPMIIGGILRDKRADCIHEWFEDYYGDKLLIDFNFGHVVLSIDGDPYLYIVPYVLGHWKGNIEIDKLICGMTLNRWMAMQEAKRDKILKDMGRFFGICRQINSLPKDILSHMEIAADELVKNIPNYGISKWESQSFTETALKHFIAEAGGSYPTGKDGHNLIKLCKIAEKYNLIAIDKTLIATNKCTADERYQSDKNGKKITITLEEAIAAHHASLDIVYLISCFLALPPELRKIEKAGIERFVVSLYVGCSINAPILIIKMVFPDKHTEVIHLHLKSANWLKDHFAETFTKRKPEYQAGNLSDIDKIANERFLKEQPGLVQVDWDNENGAKTVVSANVQETMNEFGIIFKLHGCSEEKIFRLPNMVCFHFYRYLKEVCKAPS